MKKYILTLALLLPVCASAQEEGTIVETFDGSSVLEWHTYSAKNASAMIMDGELVLQSRKFTNLASTAVALPVDSGYSYDLECSIVMPKFNKTTYFIFTYGGKVSAGFMPNSMRLSVGGGYDSSSAALSNSGVLKTTSGSLKTKSTQKKIKLTPDTNKAINLTLKVGGDITILVNNMEVARIPTPADMIPLLQISTNAVVQIKSLTIRQY